MVSLSRAKGPGTSAGTFPMALSRSGEDPRVLDGVPRGPVGEVGPPGPLELAALLFEPRVALVVDHAGPRGAGVAGGDRRLVPDGGGGGGLRLNVGGTHCHSARRH